MDRYMIKLVKEQMESLSNGCMNTHFQLFCIFEDFYNKILGKKTMLASKSSAFIITTSQNNSQQIFRFLASF